MPSKKDIRNRIRSVQSTQKITKAMKLIAIIKSKQLQNALTGMKHYSEQVSSLTNKAIKNLDIDNSAQDNFPKLLKPIAKDSNPWLIILTSDRGLCGSYNSQVLKYVHLKIEEMQSQNKKVKLVLIGTKANVYAKKFFQDCEILGRFIGLSVLPSAQDSENIFNLVETSFNEGKISSVEIIHNRFVSMIKSQVTQTKLIPFTQEQPSEKDKSSNNLNNTILFEPSVLDLVQTLIPLYCKNQIHQALLLARASELSNRVNAMGAATDNAKALMNQLTLSYNKARQASITQEIAEIVSGAESLK